MFTEYGPGRISSFGASIALGPQWGESSLANARKAARTTGGAASGIRIRNFDDGGSQAIYETDSLTHGHEGGGSERALNPTSDIWPPTSLMTG